MKHVKVIALFATLLFLACVPVSSTTKLNEKSAANNDFTSAASLPTVDREERGVPWYFHPIKLGKVTSLKLEEYLARLRLYMKYLRRRWDLRREHKQKVKAHQLKKTEKELDLMGKLHST
ncbi:hypothetical protein Plhal304r1_c012g0045991 [Plasmopara halstedii]